jgi:hypothetical protein
MLRVLASVVLAALAAFPAADARAQAPPIPTAGAIEVKCGPIVLRGLPMSQASLRCRKDDEFPGKRGPIKVAKTFGAWPGGLVEVMAGHTVVNYWATMTKRDLRQLVERWAKPFASSDVGDYVEAPFPHYPVRVSTPNGGMNSCVHGNASAARKTDMIVLLTYCEPGTGGVSPANLDRVLASIEILREKD